MAKKRKRDFLKHEKTIKKLRWLTVLFLVAGLHLWGFYLVTGEVLSFSYAADQISFRQRIIAPDPVESAEPVEEDEESEEKDLNSSDFRLVSEIKEVKEEKAKPARVIRTAVVRFVGGGLYANADVILEVHSHPFFASTQSDSKGNWSWTNYGLPLENGEHTLEAYSFLPNETSGKRDVLANKYEFLVDIDENKKEPDVIVLKDSDYAPIAGDGDLGDRLADSTSTDNAYFFQSGVINKEEYSLGDSMMVSLLVSPLKEGSPVNSKISYEIYHYAEGDTVNGQLVASFSDNVIIEDEAALLKRINLKEDSAPGNYVLKVELQVDGEKYVQASRFSISPEPVMEIGGMILTKERFSKAVVTDILFIIFFAAGIMALVMLEFRRFLYHQPIDGNVLWNKGYFSKN